MRWWPVLKEDSMSKNDTQHEPSRTTRSPIESVLARPKTREGEMYLRSDRFATHTMMTISMVAAIALGAIVSRTEGIDSNDARAMVFAIVAVWGALELFTIVLHALRFGADDLSISMGLARMSIVNYFGALALNMAGLVVVPGWYFTGSRIGLAVACGAAAMFLGREAMWAFVDLSKVGKGLLLGSLALLTASLVMLILTF